MEDVDKMNNTGEVVSVDGEEDWSEVTQGLLLDTRFALNNKKSMSVPIAELSALGAGVASLIPALNTVTTTTTLESDGLYRIANQAAGDVLKRAKNGNAWGSMRTATGGSKFVQLKEAGSLTVTSQTVAAINPIPLKNILGRLPKRKSRFFVFWKLKMKQTWKPILKH